MSKPHQAWNSHQATYQRYQQSSQALWKLYTTVVQVLPTGIKQQSDYLYIRSNQILVSTGGKYTWSSKYLWPPTGH